MRSFSFCVGLASHRDKISPFPCLSPLIPTNRAPPLFAGNLHPAHQERSARRPRALPAARTPTPRSTPATERRAPCGAARIAGTLEPRPTTPLFLSKTIRPIRIDFDGLLLPTPRRSIGARSARARTGASRHAGVCDACFAAAAALAAPRQLLLLDLRRLAFAP